MNKIVGNMLVAIMLVGIIGINVYATDDTYGAGAAAEGAGYSLEEMLQYALEDELLAQAEYAAIMEEFDVTRPFSNIAKAEITHEAALVDLYEARALEVPEFDASVHVVLPDTLAEIYEIGIQAEISNIAMYESFLEEDLETDVEAVFMALMNASKSHLQAFERASVGGGSGSDKEVSPTNGRQNGNKVRANESNVSDKANGSNRSGKGNGNNAIGNDAMVNRRNQSTEGCLIGE